MSRRLTMAGVCAALVVGLFAADSDACLFRGRFSRRAYAPEPRTSASGSQSESPRTLDELNKEIERLKKVAAQPLRKAPEMPPDVGTLLDSIKKTK